MKKIRLDLGVGNSRKREGYTTLDLKNADIEHDLELFPYPIKNSECEEIRASHIFEHICPKVFIKVMNELWRIMKSGGEMEAVVPYAGTLGDAQDPCHIGHFNENTFQYFDPEFPLYAVYKPKPWKIKEQDLGNGMMRTILICSKLE